MKAQSCALQLRVAQLNLDARERARSLIADWSFGSNAIFGFPETPSRTAFSTWSGPSECVVVACCSVSADRLEGSRLTYREPEHDGEEEAGNWGGSTDAVLTTTENPIAAAELAMWINTEQDPALRESWNNLPQWQRDFWKEYWKRYPRTNVGSDNDLSLTEDVLFHMALHMSIKHIPAGAREAARVLFNDPVFIGASSALIQSMLSGAADMAGSGGPSWSGRAAVT